MKVLAIGGGGAMGRAAVRAALSFDFVEDITLAGIDIERARRFAQSLNDQRVRAIPLDVTDAAALSAAIQAADVVLNSAGPFFRFGVPILRAALEAGKPYCDICDDWQPTLDMLALHELAQQNGVTAVIGLGASPGISNLLAAKAAAALDTVDSLVTAWKLSGAANADDGFLEQSSGPDAAAVHLVHCLSGKIRAVRDGKLQDVPPLEQFAIDYPGLGSLDVWSIGHPEAVTLPRRFPELTSCYNGMLGVAPLIESLRALGAAVDAGQLSVDAAAAQLLSGGGREARQAKLAEQERADIPGLLAWASGTRNGRPATAGAHIRRTPSGGMAEITGIPLALFLPLLRQGSVRGPGVFAPEAAVDADAFFKLLDGFVGAEGAGLTLSVREHAR